MVQKAKKQSVLTQDNDEGHDFTLNAGQTSVWLTVDDVSLYIRRSSNGGVIVEAFEKGAEADTSPKRWMEIE